MKQEIINIPRRLKELRKRTHHTKSNCAKVLDVPVDQYEGYESNKGLITLPEIELLSECFGIPITSFFQSESPELTYHPFMNKYKRSKFKQLSEKITLAKLKHKMSQQDISIEEFNSRSEISLENLQNYLSGRSPIPLKHLLRMSEALDQPISDYYSEVFHGGDLDIKESDQLSQPEEDAHKQEEKTTQEIESPTGQLAQAISQLTIRDQADIAKLILQKLKT